MKLAFKNEPQIGDGIFTINDLAKILDLDKRKVRYWLKTYWDEQLGANDQKYSWQKQGQVSVSFYTLIEFYVYYQLSEQGVKAKEMVKAHKKLSEMFNTAFPFATKEVLLSLKSDGSMLFIEYNGEYYLILDGTNQLKFGFLDLYLKKLEFEDEMVSRFYPLGKEHSIVVDPERKFGHPVIDGKNIYPETLFNHYKAGDPVKYIAAVYDLTEKQVEDALAFCKAA